jgi:DNA-binding transcriptional ArsR family regulator
MGLIVKYSLNYHEPMGPLFIVRSELADADAVFRAVSDPTRRAILELLRTEERTAGDLAAPFAMSKPAISQHLKVLREAELVSVRSAGRARVYRLNPLPLHVLFDWSALFEDFWRERLGGLRAYLDNAPVAATCAED